MSDDKYTNLVQVLMPSAHKIVCGSMNLFFFNHCAQSSAFRSSRTVAYQSIIRFQSVRYRCAEPVYSRAQRP